MALPFFFEQDITPGTQVFTLSEDSSKHCVQVLRMKEGDQLHLTDGRGTRFTTEIITAHKRSTSVRVLEESLMPAQQRRVTIAIGLVKNASRFEWFLEKATEIGVARIVPLLTARTERQHFRSDRMKGILVAAMLQSQQCFLPELPDPVSFDEMLREAHAQRLIAHCLPDEKTSLQQIQVGADVCMLIGPEGDFTSAEIDAALQSGYQPVSLGETRLRTETAGIVAAAMLMNL